MALPNTAVSAADTLAPIVGALLGDPPPVRIELWDGSALGPADGAGTLRLMSPDALRRVLWSPNELGLARAYVAGEIEADGDIYELAVALPRRADRRRRASALAQLPAALRGGAHARACSAGRCRRPRRRPACAAAGTRSSVTPRRSATTTTSATTSTGSCSARR